MVSQFLKAFRNIKSDEFALAISFCPLCDTRRILVKLYNNEVAIRCFFCKATLITMSLVSVLRRVTPQLASKEVFELSSRGPLVTYLKKHCNSVACSEFFPGVQPGSYHNGILCQDVQSLTFAEQSFDICTATEIFEHVPDDLKGFSEIYRVLRPGGYFIFTVPIFRNNTTIERTTLDKNGKITDLMPRQYHSEPIQDNKPILVFRDYGKDITGKIVSQGFHSAELLFPTTDFPWPYGRAVVVAKKKG